MPLDEYRAANRANWDDRVAIHAQPDGYDSPGFIADTERISEIVQFDSRHLDAAGKTLLHLQCHFGHDTLSWARLGAVVTGVDFSEKAIAQARHISAASGTPGRFVVSELYDTPTVLAGETFDIVYTGVGAICWLPDIHGWGGVVASMLAPGGTFYIREGHPVLWALDWEHRDLLVRYPYFEEGGPVAEDEQNTYLGSGTLANTRTYSWNHGLAEIMAALTDHGLHIERFEEHRFLEWQGHESMVEGDDGRWHLPEADRYKVPLMYTLVATKRA
jgi:SAM-dependent methyltransferase